MPTRPPRKGFAPGHDSYGGFRDKVGATHRSGRAVFEMAAYGQWGALPPGSVPVRFLRNFAWKGDRLGAYRLDAEYTWCLNYDMVSTLGIYVLFKRAVTVEGARPPRTPRGRPAMQT